MDFNINRLVLLDALTKVSRAVYFKNTLKKIKKNFGECIKGINYIQIDDKNIA